MRREPLIVTFHADRPGETVFQDYARLFRADCERLGLEHRIDSFPTTTHWSKTCRLKPFFIRDMLLSEKRPLLWIDCDCRIVRNPLYHFLAEDGPEFAAAIQQLPSPSALAFHAAVLYFDYTAACRQILARWCGLCGEGAMPMGYGDHHALVRAVLEQEKSPAGLRWEILGREYADMRPEGPDEDTIISFVQSTGIRNKYKTK